MKKILILMISGILLSGCHSVQKLRVNYKPTGKNYSNYYQDKEGIGHDENVKYSIVDENLSTIEIPIQYNASADQIPDKLPEILESYRESLESVGACYEENESKNVRYMFNKFISWCELSKNKLTLNIRHGVDSINSNQSFYLRSPLSGLNRGIIYEWQAQPDHIVWKCDTKSCVVCDKEGNIVNKIVITKNTKVNIKEINQMFIEEKQAEAKRKAEEAKRQREEAARKKKEEMEAQRWARQQKKECPGLYRTLYWAQQGMYIDPIVGVKTVKRFEELGCQWWIQRQMNQAMY